MGRPTGFMEIARQDRQYAPVSDRIQHCQEFIIPLAKQELSRQGARCMDCGTPYCHAGCPVDNIIPDWNDLVHRGEWRKALEVLHSTNNFPEFTGRVCPAPCEAACTLNLIDEAVTIKTIECAIVDRGWDKGWIEPQIPRSRTGKRVAVIGSGPAGMACAQQLIRTGHDVTVYEKRDRIGGLLRYGIPDFKLSKQLIDRRMAQMQAEGVVFRPNSHVGADISAKSLLNAFNAIILAGGSEQPRDLLVPGRELRGIHFAMDFLTRQNKLTAGDNIAEEDLIKATYKHVVVIGGGDTGSDCIGTSTRQGAYAVTQLEILPKPPEKEDKTMVWPDWPVKLRISSSQEEGCRQEWSVDTTSFEGKNGHVTGMKVVRLEWRQEGGRWIKMKIPGSTFELKADLVLLAMGFVHPTHDGILKELGVATDPRGNVQADTEHYQTSVKKVFAAGDMRSGQSLVVRAIREGRRAARAVDKFLMGRSELPG
ncbi:MAG: glutamate synthase subunit beta [Gammaproteobacteria bacterium]|nr:glutamate synthase subunit beta [Gammaproteobacteria bacterium]